MHQKDKAEKVFFEYPEVFADVINSALFDGDPVIKPESLTPYKSEGQLKLDDSKFHTFERDVIKAQTQDGKIISIIGIENQTKVDPMMPLRVLGYNTVTLLTQYQFAVKNLKPVYTIVLYFGKDKWNEKYTTLSFDKDNLDDRFTDYLPQQKIIVINVSHMPKHLIDKMKSDYKYLCEILVKRRKGLLPEHLNVKNKAAFIELVQALDKKLISDMISNGNSEVRSKMTSYVEELKREGRKEGIQIGTDNMILTALRSAKEDGLSLTYVLELLNVPTKDQNKYIKKFEENEKKTDK